MIINGLALLADPPIVNMETGKRNKHGVSWGLSEAGYDIRIKQQIIFSGKEFCSFNGHLVECASNVQIRSQEEHDAEIYEGNFVIGSSIEEFCMPNDLVGEVKDKSTWARHGLSVYNTVIEPGWKGHLTLELVYHGRQPLMIPAGAGIAQVLFYRTSNTAQYHGKYQNQGNYPTKPILA